MEYFVKESFYQLIGTFYNIYKKNKNQTFFIYSHNQQESRFFIEFFNSQSVFFLFIDTINTLYNYFLDKENKTNILNLLQFLQYKNIINSDHIWQFEKFIIRDIYNLNSVSGFEYLIKQKKQNHLLYINEFLTKINKKIQDHFQNSNDKFHNLLKKNVEFLNKNFNCDFKVQDLNFNIINDFYNLDSFLKKINKTIPDIFIKNIHIGNNVTNVSNDSIICIFLNGNDDFKQTFINNNKNKKFWLFSTNEKYLPKNLENRSNKDNNNSSIFLNNIKNTHNALFHGKHQHYLRKIQENHIWTIEKIMRFIENPERIYITNILKIYSTPILNKNPPNYLLEDIFLKNITKKSINILKNIIYNQNLNFIWQKKINILYKKFLQWQQNKNLITDYVNFIDFQINHRKYLLKIKPDFVENIDDKKYCFFININTYVHQKNKNLILKIISENTQQNFKTVKLN